jgi:hypothetical protein
MWSAPVVIHLPFFKRSASVVQCAEQRLVQTFISQLAVEAFDETILLGLARCDVMPIDAGFLHPLGIAMLVNSVPLSETIVVGMPRSAITRSNSRVTRKPDKDVSATNTRFSRLKSSTTARMRKRQPSVRASDTKSNDQRWFGPSTARQLFACAVRQ